MRFLKTQRAESTNSLPSGTWRESAWSMTGEGPERPASTTSARRGRLFSSFQWEASDKTRSSSHGSQCAPPGSLGAKTSALRRLSPTGPARSRTSCRAIRSAHPHRETPSSTRTCTHSPSRTCCHGCTSRHCSSPEDRKIIPFLGRRAAAALRGRQPRRPRRQKLARSARNRRNLLPGVRGKQWPVPRRAKETSRPWAGEARTRCFRSLRQRRCRERCRVAPCVKRGSSFGRLSLLPAPSPMRLGTRDVCPCPHSARCCLCWIH